MEMVYMQRRRLIRKLSQHTGLTYLDAWRALSRVNWDLVAAIDKELEAKSNETVNS